MKLSSDSRDNNQGLPPAQRVAGKIRAGLEQGIRLESGVLHYLESVAGVCEPPEIVREMQDPESCDSQSLFELIFFPGESDQLRLEPELEKTPLDRRGLCDVKRALFARQIRTRLIFPDGTTTCEITMPENAAEKYVNRLNLDRRIPQELAETINEAAGDRDTAMRIRVRVRNTRFEFSQTITSFLRTYLENMPVESGKDIRHLAWILDFLDQIGSGTDIYSEMMEEKQRASEMLRRAADSDHRLSRQPVEALIMQGINIPSIPTGEVIEKINAIDRIAFAVFGKTELAGQESPVNLGIFSPRGDIEKVIKILS